jgi:hypothetical protein
MAIIKKSQTKTIGKKQKVEMSYPTPSSVRAAAKKQSEGWRPEPFHWTEDMMKGSPFCAAQKYIIDRLASGQTRFCVPKSIAHSKEILYMALLKIERAGGWADTAVIDCGDVDSFKGFPCLKEVGYQY